MKRLSGLAQSIPGLISYSGEDVFITGINMDSRTVKPGDIFIAFKGIKLDGHRFIPDAINAGAAAVVGTNTLNLSVPYLRVKDSRKALAYISAAFYDFPARKMRMIGITGTDGKTTTSNLLFHILRHSGIEAGLISTVNAVIGDRELDTGFHVTTPDAPDLQRYLSLMFEAGLTHVVVETTSHGLEQRRVDGCEFDIGIVTNITHEHLDAHNNSLEQYRAAKALLFSSLANTKPKKLGNPRLSITNRDDWSYEYLQSFITGPQISYGLTKKADIYAEDTRYDPTGIQFTAVGGDFQVKVRCNLTGAFNIENCLAALSAGVVGVGIKPSVAAEGIASLPQIPGRMERISLGQDFTVVVDFAHTPNALLNALKSVRSMTDGRVIVVFGSAGLRDREKRRMMAEISAERADFSIFTAEDPRTESLYEILSEMADGAASRGGVENKTYWRIKDRGDAMRFALRLAQPQDVVIACGKGHEQSMCFGTIEYPWDDRVAMKAALAEHLGIKGPDMPYLPTKY